jgi:hypothetical protein
VAPAPSSTLTVEKSRAISPRSNLPSERGFGRRRLWPERVGAGQETGRPIFDDEVRHSPDRVALDILISREIARQLIAMQRLIGLTGTHRDHLGQARRVDRRSTLHGW